jgi:hypothetical protein
MKILLVKDFRDTGMWGDKDILGIPREISDILKAAPYRTQSMGLLCDLEADMRIAQVNPEWYLEKYGLDKNKSWLTFAAMKYPSKNLPLLSEIDYSIYDVVICSDPYIPKDIIDKHPRTVFGYWDYFNPIIMKAPSGGYDLQLNHLEGPDNISGLPQMVFFHYPVSLLMQEEFKGVEKTIIGTEDRTALENYILNKKFSELSTKTLTATVLPRIQDGYDYYKSMARCKYFVYIRNWMGGSGQQALEAAALGCILIGYHGKKPFESVVHPSCRITPTRTPTAVAIPFDGYGYKDIEYLKSLISKIDSNDGIRKDILDYQRNALTKMFNNNVKALEKAVALKRKVI